MTIHKKAEPVVLLLGDIIFFISSLWLTLLVRYLELPSRALFYNHLSAFSVLFVVWVGVFFFAGLYEKHTLHFQRRLPSVILKAQLINIIIAALFIFVVPVGLSPKTNLFIYVLFSSPLIMLWRILFPRLRRRFRQGALIIGSGAEVEDLRKEVNNNTRYSIVFVHQLGAGEGPEKLPEGLRRQVENGELRTVVFDRGDGRARDTFSRLEKLAGRPLFQVDTYEAYERIFDRIPLSRLELPAHGISTARGRMPFYEGAKRAVDLALSFVCGALLLLMLPVIALAIKFEDGGSVFITQRRIGRGGKTIRVYKFRTMSFNEDGVWLKESTNKVTFVGNFLRKTSIDELPQLINVITGELSFIGPRTDVEGLALRLRQAIPYYDERYRVLPGISGWAQINQYYFYELGNISPQTIEETKLRLAYDLYYVKHRSFLLDAKIIAYSIKAILSRFI